MAEEKVWLLNGTNYGNWKFRMEVLLEDRGLLDCVQEPLNLEDLAELQADSADEKLRKRTLRTQRVARDRSCRNLLVNRIAEDQLDHVKDARTAKQTWDALRDVFERVGIAGKLFLKKQFQELRLAEGGDVPAFLLKFEKMLRELKAAGVKLEKEDVVCQLLLALPRSFDALITAVETIEPKDLTLEYVKKRILDEQVKRNAQGASDAEEGSSGESAFAGKKWEIKCFGCGRAGHKRVDCPDGRSDRKEPGKNAKSRSGKSTRKSGGANVTCENPIAFGVATGNAGAFSTPAAGRRIEWILDSGATDHMVRDKTLFDELRPLERKVRISVAKSGQSLIAESAGTVKVKMSIKGKSTEAVVHDVLYVPELQCNLFSVRRLEDIGMTVKFAGGKVFIENAGRIVGSGRRSGQLYVLDVFRDGDAAGDSNRATAMTSKNDDYELWHRRFGHLGEANMRNLWKHGMVHTTAKIKNWPESCVCGVCQAAKQTRTAFGKADGKRSSRPLELIHSDVCGPFTTSTWDRKRYFVSFLDDFSHFAVMYLLESKDEVLEKFQEYHARVTAYFGVKVARLRCDNGGEYTSKAFKKFCRMEGICMEPTVPYSPQQNGKSERFNRTTLDKARSMLQDSGLPKSLWGEAVLTATYLLNRSPTTALKEKKTPHEMWYGTKPDIDKLRVFGSAAHTWIPKEKRGKLDARSEQNVMVGYFNNGYRIWNPRTKKLFTSRDVVFDEHGKNRGQPVTRAEESYEQVGRQAEPAAQVQPAAPLNQDGDEPAEDGTDEEEPVIEVSDDENKEEPVPGPSKQPVVAEITDDEDEGMEETIDDPSGRQPVVAELTEDEDEEGLSGALPSQSERGHCSAEGSTRRSERERKTPGKFLDYILQFGKNTAGGQLTDSSESTLMAYALNAETFVENLPSTIDGLKRRSDWSLWKEAINSELESLRKNETWELVPKPAKKNIVDCKWVFRVKRDEAGNVDRYKARLVAKGFSQRRGFDYDETYAPVAKITTVRVLLALTNQAGHHVHQMDVRTAFLNGVLKEEIYMRQPDGFQSGDPNLVCRLKKSLYGLKQAPRSWNSEFNTFVLKLGLKRSDLDSCLYWRKSNGCTIYLLLYVDDILLVSNRLEMVNEIKKKLSSRFEMSDMGSLKHFLGLKVEYKRSGGTMKISQPKYVIDLLNRFGMADCKPVSTPLDPNLKLEKRRDEAVTEKPFRELIGCLTYLTMASRPDINAAVNYFSRFQSAPTDNHWSHLKRVLRYLRGTIELGLVFRRCEKAQPLIGFADADWGNNLEDRRSVSGNVFQVYGATVSWSSRKQSTVALSSTEAEYVSLSQAICEAIWLRNLLVELGVTFNRPVQLFEDNQSCIRIAEEPREHKRMKHVDIRYNFIREKIQEGLFKLNYIRTEEQLADIFTKGLSRGQFEVLRTKIGQCV